MMKTLFILLFTIGLHSCSKIITEDAGTDSPGLNWITPKVNAPNTEHVIFYSSVVNANVSFHIYLPNDYTYDEDQRFPVIYWLHGSGGGIDGILPLVNHFKNAMDQNKIPHSIIVFPHGLDYGMWCNSKDGKQPVENMLIEDLIPYVDQNYKTIANRKGRIIEGFSMGAYGAARLGLKYHDLFGGISMFAAGPLQLDFSKVATQNQAIQPVIFKKVYGEDMDYFVSQSPWRMAELYGSKLSSNTPFRIMVGNLDFVYNSNIDYHNHLNSLQIDHKFYEFEYIGHAVPPLFTALGMYRWTFYNEVFH